MTPLMPRLPHIIIYILLLPALLSGAESFAASPLRLPDIPATITRPADRADYLMAHFWDHISWHDTDAILADTAALELNISTYYSIAPHVRPRALQSAIAALADTLAAHSALIPLVADLTAKYLDEPQSPVYSELCYEHFCREMARVTPPESTDNLLFSYHAQRLAANRPGTKAADFTFIDRHGNTSTLHTAIDTTATEVFLLFFDPDCTDCHRTISAMLADKSLNDPRTQVILITPVDTDLRQWTDTAASLPARWTVGYSPQGAIDADDIYHISHIPLLYILSPTAIVLQRDSNRYSR